MLTLAKWISPTGSGRQRGDIGRGIPAVVMGADTDVIDVAQDAETGAGCDRRHELPFRNNRIAEGDVGRGVFDQDASPQMGLRLVDVAAHDFKRFLGHWQGKQIGEVSPTDDIPGDMLGHQAGLDPLGNLPDALEMRRIDPFGAAE